MKTLFSSDFSLPDSHDLHLANSNNYDIQVIEQYIHNPQVPLPMNESQLHDYLVTTRKRLDVIINAIKTYENNENENTENSKDFMADN